MGNQTTPSSQSSPSYSHITQADCFPKKDQAIIIDVIDNTQLKDYSQALAKVISSVQIRFISRISGNRVCAYVATKKLADELVEKHKVIHIQGQSLPIRPLITRNKRIIISNVCPAIPHYVLDDKLKELKIKLTSPMTFLRAGLAEPGFNYILSFRRQIYIAPDDIIPDSLQINFEDTNYWIYLTADTMSCFLCKQQGHIAKNGSIQTDNVTTDLPESVDGSSSIKQMPPPSTPTKSLTLKFPTLPTPTSPVMTILSERPHPPSSSGSSLPPAPLNEKEDMVVDGASSESESWSDSSIHQTGKGRQTKNIRHKSPSQGQLNRQDINKIMKEKSYPLNSLL